MKVNVKKKRTDGSDRMEITGHLLLDSARGLGVQNFSFSECSFSVDVFMSTERGTGYQDIYGGFSMYYSELLQQLPNETLIKVFSEEIARRIKANENASEDRSTT